jgi:hypothetical protein
MGSITIHAIEPELDRKLSDEARERGTSKNALVKELLSRSLGLTGAGGASFRDFCGLWNEAERAEFDRIVVASRVVDPEDWA